MCELSLIRSSLLTDRQMLRKFVLYASHWGGAAEGLKPSSSRTPAHTHTHTLLTTTQRTHTHICSSKLTKTTAEPMELHSVSQQIDFEQLFPNDKRTAHCLQAVPGEGGIEPEPTTWTHGTASLATPLSLPICPGLQLGRGGGGGGGTPASLQAPLPASRQNRLITAEVGLFPIDKLTVTGQTPRANNLDTYHSQYRRPDPRRRRFRYHRADTESSRAHYP